MDNKVQNIILKALTIILIGTGVLMTYMVMNDENPYSMSSEEKIALGEKEYSKKKEKLEYADAQVWIKNKSDEIVSEKEETLTNDVSNVIDFTTGILILSGLLVLASFVYLITIDYKKALKILAGVAALFLFLIISYYTASDQVPACIAAMDGELDVCQKAIYTSANWKIASAAISTTLILIIITALAWISGPVMKLFR